MIKDLHKSNNSIFKAHENPEKVSKQSLATIKPISNAQVNRIVSPQVNTKFKHDSNTITAQQKKTSEQVTKLKTYDPIIYSKKYNDLLTENASFIDSPIHLLMSHHKNQRMLKQKKYELEIEKQMKLNHQSNFENLDQSRTNVEQPQKVRWF